MGTLRAVDLRTEHAVLPRGIERPDPWLAWRLASEVPEEAGQSAFRIVVGDEEGVVVWDSGRRSGAELGIRYAGDPLVSDRTYTWHVEVWDRDGGDPRRSDAAVFETGLFRASDWTAHWIGRGAPRPGDYGGQRPAPLLRRKFRLPEDRAVARARLRISGLGCYEAHLNGERVGDHVLDPAFTGYDRTVLYETYDLTDRLRPGPNALGVELGTGFFGAPDDGEQLGWQHVAWNSDPELLLQLDIRYDDGTFERVSSDTDWRFADGPTVGNYIRTGETYDARLAIGGWAEPGFDDSGWTPVRRVESPGGTLHAQDIEPIRVQGELEPVAVTEPRDGLRVYDFGQITTGRAEIRVRGAAGTRLRLSYGDALHDDGTVDASIGFYDNGSQTDTYILNGTGVESWEPRFVFHGYRYVEVGAEPNLPEILGIRGRILHTTVDQTGEFDCDNDLFVRLHEAINGSIRTNLQGLPCHSPQTEKISAIGDVLQYSDAAIYAYDVQRMWRKWLRDMADTQTRDGSIGFTAPQPADSVIADIANDPQSSGGFITVAHDLYRYYGDLDVLHENYRAMSRWLDRQIARYAPFGGLHIGFSIGDYGPPIGTGNDKEAVATLSTLRYARLLAEIADILGHPGDAERYRAHVAQLTALVNLVYLDTDSASYGAPWQYHQTPNLMAIAYDVVPEEHRDAVLGRLVEDIEKKDGHLDTGSVGAKLVLPVLTDRGYLDLAYTVATRTTYPSWGYWIEGLGYHSSVPDGWLPDASMNSPWYGTIQDWFYTHLAGITPALPGYARVRIKPHLPTGLDRVRAQVGTPYGPVVSVWTRSGGSTTLTVEVPIGTTAEVHLPPDHSTVRHVGPGAHTFACP